VSRRCCLGQGDAQRISNCHHSVERAGSLAAHKTALVSVENKCIESFESLILGPQASPPARVEENQGRFVRPYRLNETILVLFNGGRRRRLRSQHHDAWKIYGGTDLALWFRQIRTSAEQAISNHTTFTTVDG